MARLRPWILAAALLVPVAGYMIANAQQTQQTNAVELTVLSAGAMRAALAELVPLFERSSGHKLIIEYGMVGMVEEKMVGDAPVDVAILTRPPFDKLVGSGRIAGGSATLLARVPIGLAVKNDAARPDISTVETFTKALHEARIVTYGDPGPGLGDAAGVHIAAVIERLGLAPELKTKTRLNSPAQGQSSAQYLTGLFQRGEAEIAMAPISVLSETGGIDIVGLLPAELQSANLVFVAGTASTCRHPSEAKELLGFLAGESARAVYRAKGMQPD